ncbi:MAG: signal peptide peptidase SppA [Bacteroidales bacterium]|nr:signal peptide peptidase SppA [Bacteroidales bacterium]
MKQFFKIFFASIFGTIVGLFLLVLFIVGFSAALVEDDSAKYEEKNVLLLKNTISVGEITTPSAPGVLSKLEQNNSELGLYDILRVLENVKTDSRINGVVLEDVFVDAGYETVGEITQALQEVRKSGKFVVAYFNTLSQKSYLLASACDEISMNAEGMAEFHGVSSSSVHYKHLLEKIGMKPVVIRCGKYKSYVESVTNDKMSEENREQKQAYIDTLWKTYEILVKINRPEVDVKDLNSFADSGLVCLPTELFAKRFIDTIQYADEFWNSVKKRMDVDEKKSIATVSLRSYIEDYQKELTEKKKENVAVVIAQGSIDMGKSDGESIGGDTYVNLFRKIRKDSTVKSVVFRINSGGGSALASELIWREVELTAKEKPVIVSMGDYAASGGYYIAAPATQIVASPMTLTGSIGVFGMSLTAEGLMDKIGVSIDNVNTHANSDFGNMTRDLNPVEIRAIEKTIDNTYATFKNRVSVGRNMNVNQVEEIAQGRIWSGMNGKENGLVDKLSIASLKTAFRCAVEAAELTGVDYGVEVFPKSQTFFDVMMENLDSQTSVLEKYTKDAGLLEILQNIPEKSGIYAQIPYSLTIK